MQTSNNPPRRFTLIRGEKLEGTRVTAAERSLRRRQFQVYDAIADGRTNADFSDVAPWLEHPVAPDEAA